MRPKTTGISPHFQEYSTQINGSTWKRKKSLGIDIDTAPELNYIDGRCCWESNILKPVFPRNCLNMKDEVNVVTESNETQMVKSMCPAHLDFDFHMLGWSPADAEQILT